MAYDTKNTLTRLIPLYRWHEMHVASGAAIFLTFASLQWFIRQNKEALVREEVMIPGRGGRVTLVTPLFGDACYRILMKKANQPEENCRDK
ncbi:hypothetical protein NOR51B_2514 [Luminiphilus syltensis NOR5-1B]|uniref:Uncharacterized protein n=1 Tax=Luminiphilus syltensis NOR5-1B TaxID=565045 RepID=B8KTC2_9GAMM|nr:hypothetical protein [Luminiphilus syltensis]EED36562.1 hypothetical protein NOR51B_2514 [Luminiphilus syltensis NOR5-1B]